MSFLRKLLGKSETPKQRVQVCVECGMPVADHKQWCSILQGQNELKLKAGAEVGVTTSRAYAAVFVGTLFEVPGLAHDWQQPPITPGRFVMSPARR